MHISQTSMNLTNAQEMINHHLYHQVQQSSQSQQQRHITALQE